MVAFDASALFSKNLLNFLSTFVKDKNIFDIETEDELLQKSIIIKNGAKTENFYEVKKYG